MAAGCHNAHVVRFTLENLRYCTGFEGEYTNLSALRTVWAFTASTWARGISTLLTGGNSARSASAPFMSPASGSSPNFFIFSASWQIKRHAALERGNQTSAVELIRPIRIVPHGRQPGMKPIMLRGVVEIDPYRDDFFKVLIEQRKANESDKTLKRALKVIANSTAYGAFVELNEERKSKPVQLDVFSGEHHHRQSARDIELPGKWYFPALASLITSGGRLLLAMAEQCVTDAGGTWLFADTDSLAVVASPTGGIVYPKRPEEECEMDQRETAPIPVLLHSTVLEMVRRFRSLNPYAFGGDVLKVEDVNYENGDPNTDTLRIAQGYAVSSKRYAVMEGSKIIEVKGHGLGYLMSPASGDEPDWMQSAWEYSLRLLSGDDEEFLSLRLLCLGA